MTFSTSSPLIRNIRYFLVMLSAIYLCMYLWVVFSRINYPFELEWIEGGLLDQTQRILAGDPVYAPPSVEFVPFLYPPMYFYVSALFSSIFGASFFSLRLVSFTASLVSLATIYRITTEETHDRVIGCISAGIFIATFRITGAWLDIARVDSLFLAFYLLFVHAIRKQTWQWSLVAGIWASLAFLTKQTALVGCLPIVFYCTIVRWKSMVPFFLSVLALVGGSTLYLNSISDGWYQYYVFDLLNQQTEWVFQFFFLFWTKDLIMRIPLLVALALLFLTGQMRRQQGRPDLRWLAICVGAIGTSYISRVKVGGYSNVLLPGYAVLSILFGLGLQRVVLDQSARSRALAAMVPRWAYVACVLQMALIAYNPVQQVPTADDERAGYAYVNEITRLEGDVYIPYHPYLAVMAGKKSYAHQSAVWDVMRGETINNGKDVLRTDMERAVHARRFATIILDSTWHFLPDLEIYYREAGVFPLEDDVFYPMTSNMTRPIYIFSPRQ